MKNNLRQNTRASQSIAMAMLITVFGLVMPSLSFALFKIQLMHYRLAQSVPWSVRLAVLLDQKRTSEHVRK